MERGKKSRIVIVLLALVLAADSRAAFHLNPIDEVMSGVNGDPSVQYVEVRVLVGQTIVANTRLTAFDCTGSTATVLLLVPANVPNSPARFIMATTNFAAAAGITPDFTWDPGMTGSIPPACGMVCWGAPGVVPPGPGTWSASDPNQYVDCVAYGGYTGTTKTSTHDGTPTSGTPTGLAAGDEMLSLTRGTTTGNNVADFALACPTPTNNAGMAGGFGPCVPPTTTTTTATTTTTTTVPAGVDESLTGKVLLLKDDPSNATRKQLKAISKDSAITLGGGYLSPDDPKANGATLRVRSSSAGFDPAPYTLDASLWSYIGVPPGGLKGYKYKNPAGPITLAILKKGKLIQVKGKGSGLTHTLASDPNPVDVVLTTGGKGYCMQFGGDATFVAGVKYLAKNSLAMPCPP